MYICSLSIKFPRFFLSSQANIAHCSFELKQLISHLYNTMSNKFVGEFCGFSGFYVICKFCLQILKCPHKTKIQPRPQQMVRLVRFWLDRYFQGKNKIPCYKRQVINKSTRVSFELVQLFILQYSRQKKHNNVMRWKISATYVHA